MARIVSILFLGIFILSYTAYSVRHSLPYLQYNLNKEYVAQNLCINKGLPASTCEGKCYLKDQLEKSVNQENDSENGQNCFQFEIFLENYHSQVFPVRNSEGLSRPSPAEVLFLSSISIKIPSPPPNS